MSLASDSDNQALTGAGASLWHSFARGVRDNIVAEVAVQILRVGGMVLAGA
jgi:hypothetical protein